MDEKDILSPEPEDLDLEEVLKEFAAPEEAPASPEPAPVEPEEAKNRKSKKKKKQIPPAPEEGALPEDATRKLSKLKRKKEKPQAEAQPTIVTPETTSDTLALPALEDIKAKEDPSGEPTRKLPVVEAPADQPSPPADPESPREEPSQEEYVPYKPIRFQPKDQLRSLKRKLVAGPEKRYYELSEIGVGKLQVAMLLSLLVFFTSAMVTAMDALGYVAQERLRLMVFIQFFGLLLAGLFGCYQMMEGIGGLFRGRFSANTLLFFTFCVCCVDGVFCFRQERVPCCAAFSLQVFMSLWGAYHRRIWEMGQMDTLRKASRIYGIYEEPDYYQGRKGLLREEGDVNDFMQNYSAPSGPERAFSWYAFFALMACIGVGVAGGVLHRDVSFGVRACSAALLMAAPVTCFITLSRPQAILGKRLHGVGGVLCGWQGIQGMSGNAYFALSHEDLFPVGTCKLNGVKFFQRERSLVVSYATALVDQVGGALVPLFDHLLETSNGWHCTAENLRTYPNGGVGGEVDGESVLVGTPAFLKDMGVEVPENIRVNHAVFIAIDGELCGLVAVTYVKHREQAAGIGTLCAHRGLFPVFTTGDFMLTPDFLREKFTVNPRRMVFPEWKERQELAAKTANTDMPALALTTHDNLASYAYCVTGARTLRIAQRLGLGMHILAGVVGIAIMAVLTILGIDSLLTPANMLLYQLVWLVPGFLLTEWTRYV